MSSSTFDMVRCQMCRKRYVTIEEDVCHVCTPRYEVSLAYQAMNTSLEVLKKHMAALNKEEDEKLLSHMEHELNILQLRIVHNEKVNAGAAVQLVGRESTE